MQRVDTLEQKVTKVVASVKQEELEKIAAQVIKEREQEVDFHPFISSCCDFLCCCSSDCRKDWKNNRFWMPVAVFFDSLLCPCCKTCPDFLYFFCCCIDWCNCLCLNYCDNCREKGVRTLGSVELVAGGAGFVGEIWDLSNDISDTEKSGNTDWQQLLPKVFIALGFTGFVANAGKTLCCRKYKEKNN